MQGWFPYLLTILGGEMPQYWFGTSDVLDLRTHFMSVLPATTLFLLCTDMAIMYITGNWHQLHNWPLANTELPHCKLFFLQRRCSKRYMSGKLHLSVWVQLWRPSSCWWRKGEWGESGDLCGGVLGDCVWQWVGTGGGNGCVQATWHADIWYDESMAIISNPIVPLSLFPHLQVPLH